MRPNLFQFNLKNDFTEETIIMIIIIRAKFTPGGGTPPWIDPSGICP